MLPKTGTKELRDNATKNCLFVLETRVNFVLRKWETWYSNYAILMVAINGFHKCSASTNTWPLNEVSALSKYLFLSVCGVVTETKTMEKKYPQKQV